MTVVEVDLKQLMSLFGPVQTRNVYSFKSVSNGSALDSIHVTVTETDEPDTANVWPFVGLEIDTSPTTQVKRLSRHSAK